MFKHINASLYLPVQNVVAVGDKVGNVAILDPENLEVLASASIGRATIQAITAARSLLCTLNKNYTVSLFSLCDGQLIHRKTINLLEHFIENGQDFRSTESQAIALSPSGRKLAVLGPNTETLYSEINADFSIARCSQICFATNSVAVTYRWVTEECFLVGFGNGHIARFNTTLRQVNLVKIKGVDETVHWFEPEVHPNFLLATDARRVVRLNAETLDYAVGQVVARDDLEHVTRHRASGAIYASSFDRNVYALNPDLSRRQVAYRAAFKTRWVHAIGAAGECRLLVQVRNGDFQRVDPEQGRVEKSLSSSRPALWTAAWQKRTPVFAGEGGLYEIVGGRLSRKAVPAEVGPLATTSIKRMVRSADRWVCGTTDGRVVVVGHGQSWQADAGSAVRDVCLRGSDAVLFCTEAGLLCELHLPSMRTQVLFKTESEPLWSVAHDARSGLVAAGERLGRVLLFAPASAGELNPVAETDSRIPKRMKWVGDDTLLVVHSDCIDKIQKSDGQWRHRQKFFNGNSNTVEDFSVVERGTLIVGVTYNKHIIVWDAATGNKLSQCFWNFDYAKGILVDPSSDSEFYVYGRDMTVKKFGVHDGQIFCIETFK